MSKIEDIFTVKRVIKDMKKVCSHYSDCYECPVQRTHMCELSAPPEWDSSALFKEKR